MIMMMIIIVTTYYLTLAFIDDVALPTLAILFIHYFLTSPNQTSPSPAPIALAFWPQLPCRLRQAETPRSTYYIPPIPLYRHQALRPSNRPKSYGWLQAVMKSPSCVQPSPFTPTLSPPGLMRNRTRGTMTQRSRPSSATLREQLSLLPAKHITSDWILAVPAWLVS